jgi:ribosomal protein L22
MVIRQIRKRGRLTKAQQLKRTERESLTKSSLFRTSTKKLGMLARQIAGKPIEDAIVQMRFSKKLVAQEVRSHLEYARDSAIVRRGLGLGKAEDRTGEPVQIQLKNGSRKFVNDRTGIYIDQAWVNRGKYGRSPEFRARGKMNILYHPHTSKSHNNQVNASLLLTLSQAFQLFLRKRQLGSGFMKRGRRKSLIGSCGSTCQTGRLISNGSTLCGEPVYSHLL